MKNISVNKAIARGHQIVNYPLIIWMIAGFGLTIYLMTVLENAWIFPVGFVATFAAAWLWWSVMITQWRIWAFTNVRNVHELKRKAVNQKLIWHDGSWFEKTEIRTRKQRMKLEELEGKFKLQDIVEHIEDDKSIPFETKIYISKISKWVFLMSFLMMIGVGVFGIIHAEWYGYVLAGIGVWAMYSEIPKYLNSKPQVVLNENGIETINTGFTLWKDILKAFVQFEGVGDNARWYLYINFKKGYMGKEKIDISDFNTSARKLEYLIKLYQQRNKEAQKRN